MRASIGRWVVDGGLGKGARGAVLRGHGPDGAPVAIKLLEGGASAPAEVRERFAREALALARVSHPNVVAVRDHGEAGGQPYLVMDLVEGRSLGGRLEEGPLPPRAAATLALTLARALEHVHAAGLLHRDIKPDNVVVRPTGEPVLVDFGLARDEQSGHSLTQSGALLGTPGYLAPEQAVGARADVRSDVYGLGATLYAALTGRPPIEGDSLPAVLMATKSATPPPPSSLARDAGGAGWGELDRLVLRALEKEPERRHPTAAALGDALEGWLRAQRGARTRRRRRTAGPAVVVLACVGGAASLASLLLALVLHARQDRARPEAQAGTQGPVPSSATTSPAAPSSMPAQTAPVASALPDEEVPERVRQAEALVDEALALDPNDPHDLTRIEELSRRALALAPDLGPARATAAFARATRLGTPAAREEALAELDLVTASARPWRGPDADRLRGLLLAALGHHAQATALLRPLLAARPRDGPLAWTLGLSARASGDPATAVEAFEAVVRLRGERSLGWQLPFNLAGALATSPERKAEAVRWYDLAIELGRGQVPICALREAQLLAGLLRPEEALARLDQATGLAPSDEVDQQRVRVVCLEAANRLGEALVVARLQAGRTPGVDSVGIMARLLHETGEVAEARSVLERALASQENAYWRSYLVELRAGDGGDVAMDEALKVAEARLRATPSARDDGDVLNDVVDLARAACPAATRAFWFDATPDLPPRWTHRIVGLLRRAGLGQHGPGKASRRAEALVHAARCMAVLGDVHGTYGALERACAEAPDDPRPRIARAELALSRFDLKGAAELRAAVEHLAANDATALRAARMLSLVTALQLAQDGKAPAALALVDDLLRAARDEPKADEPGWRGLLERARSRVAAAAAAAAH